MFSCSYSNKLSLHKLRILKLRLAVFVVPLVFAFLLSSALAAPPDEHPGLKNGHAELIVTFTEPLNGRERGQLTRSGVRFVQAMSGNKYLVKVRSQGLTALESHSSFVTAATVQPGDKLSQPLAQGNPGEHAITENGDISIFVQFYPDVSLGTAVSTLRKVGIDPGHPQRLLFNARLSAEASPEQIQALSESVQVRFIETVPPPKQDLNVVSAQVANVDTVQAAPYNLDGDGVLFGMWESGNPQGNHPMLNGRITSVQGSTTDHGTHVGGTILGDGTGDATALGMSPSGDQIFSYTSAGDTATEQSNSVANDEIVISNHSWGSSLGWTFSGGSWSDNGNDSDFGNYNGTARDWDAMVRSTGLIVDKAAGNDGADCDPADATDCDGFFGADTNSYDTVGTQGNAKNIITVGAINDNGTTITGFSSIGPSNDGRIKPDLVANGANLNSSCQGSTYCSKSGTSMSTPSVTGATGLLVESYRQPGNFGTTPSPDVVKALWVNTATDLGRPGPDYVFGHGLIDAQLAVDTIDAGQVRILTDSVDQGDTNSYQVTIPAGVSQFRATLNWLDPAAVAGANPTLINDLDLLMTDPNFNNTFPFMGPGTGAANVEKNATATGANTVDTVEHAVAGNPDQGYWTVQVSGTSVPAGPQGYALVVNGYDSSGQLVAPLGFVLDSEPDIRVNALLDFNEVCPPAHEDRIVTIFNIGGAVLLVNSVAVTNTGGPSDAFSLAVDPSQPFSVAPGAHVDVTVRFAPDQNGDFSGQLTIESNDEDQPSLVFELTGSGGVQELSTTMDNNFGDVCLLDTLTHDLLITNSGSCPLSVSAISIDDSQFSLATVMNYPLVIAPGSEVTVPIDFSPSLTTGSKSADLTIDSDDPAVPEKVIGLQGFAPSADIETFIADNGNFGEVCAGSFMDLNLTVQNNGACPLRIDSVGLTLGPNALVGDFDLPSGNVDGTIIESGNSVQVPIRFSPSVFDLDPPLNRLATLNVASRTQHETDPDPLNNTGISGQVPPPDIQAIIANTGNFGVVCKGDHADLDLLLLNQGRCDLTISSIKLFDGLVEDMGSFELPVNLTFPLVLSHDADYTVPVRYAPEVCSDVPEERIIKIISDDPDEMTVNLDIEGVSPCPNLIIDPTALSGLYAFPTTVVDTGAELGCYSERDVTLRNTGLCPLTISDISAADSDFTVMAPTVFPTPGIVLPTGEETLIVTLRFTPQSDSDPQVPNEVTGLLTIISDDPDFPHTADLCGESAQQSGVRILVSDVSSGQPIAIDEVDSMAIQSKGKNRPGPINLQFTDQPLSSLDVCGNNISWHVNQETLPSTSTTGSNPKSSYQAKAMEGNLQTSETFSLGQCEFRDFQLELQDSDSPICLLEPKGAVCTTDGDCCSNKCKGPRGGAKSCK